MKKSVLFLATVLFLIGCPEGEGKNIDVAPRITLIGPSEVFFNVDDIYIEYGYTATDVDGNDVSSLVRRDTSTLNMGKEGSYQISYVAVDRKGVKSDAVYRTVNVGNAFAPEITISGSNPLLLKLNGEFTQPSATAMAYDGTDLSDSIQVNAESVDTTKVGTYIVSYTVTDSSGVTGTAQLYVYVMESSSPRIVVEGVGSAPENPYPIQILSSESSVGPEDHLSSALPFFQAYDLEDGDISYKVQIDKNDVYNELITALTGTGDDETPFMLSLIVSDSDGNTPNPLPVFYVSVVPDTTPPVITFDYDQQMYELTNFNLWKVDDSGWRELLNKIAAKIYDNSWSSPDYVPIADIINATEEERETKYNGVKAGIVESAVTDVLNLGEDRVDDFLQYYNYNDPSDALNIKTVTFWAEDKAANRSERKISVMFKDITPPEITMRSVTIPFGSTDTSIPGQGLKFRDNSGLTGTCTGLEAAKVDMALVQGLYSVKFDCRDNSLNSKSVTTNVEVLPPVTVGSNYKVNNAVSNGDFSQHAESTAVAPENLSASLTTGWDILGQGNYYYHRPTAGSGKISAPTQWDAGWDNRMICGVVYTGNTSAYYTVGAVYVSGWGVTNWFTNQTVSIFKTQANMKLWPGVTYAFGFDIASFKNWKDDYVAGNLKDGGKRTFTVIVTKDTDGSINSTGTKEASVEFSVSSTNSSVEGQPFEFMKNKNGESGYSKYTWTSVEESFKVVDKEITEMQLQYHIVAPDGGSDADDYASLTTGIRIYPSSWPARKPGEANGPIGTASYNKDTGAVTWSEN